MNIFEQLLADKDLLLADGATGTNLFAMGLQSGDPPELWNIEQPEKIKAHYSAFIEAGSDIILTNTFGANSYRLMLHRAESRVAELNTAAVELASQVIADSGRRVAIAGSIGPTGEILEPIGTLSHDNAYSAFKQQCDALARAGAHVLWIETMSSSAEMSIAIEAAQNTGIPIIYTASFDTNGKTMMGLSCADVVAIAKQFKRPPIAFGTNCGVGASEVVAVISQMKKTAGNSLLVAKANCGIPKFVDGEIKYSGTPELMAKYAILARNAGAKIVGGCCGTTPEHIKVMRQALDNDRTNDLPTIAIIEQTLGPISAGLRSEMTGLSASSKPARSRARKRSGR